MAPFARIVRRATVSKVGGFVTLWETETDLVNTRRKPWTKTITFTALEFDAIAAGVTKAGPVV